MGINDYLKARKFFTADEVDHLNKAMKYTPDVFLLSCYSPWWLFVYSSDQQGHPKQFADDLYQPHVAYTSSTYSLWTKCLAGEAFSVALDDCNHDTVERTETITGSKISYTPKITPVARPERIKGQILKATPQMLYKLDEKYRNGVEFNRRRISLSIPFRFQFRDRDNNLKVSETYTQTLIAWAYIGVQAIWDKQISDSRLFKPAKIFKPADELWRTFYHHDKLVYDE